MKNKKKRSRKGNKTKEFLKKTKEKSVRFFKKTNSRFVDESKKIERWLKKTSMVLVKKKVFDLHLYLADMVSFLNLMAGLISTYFSLNLDFLYAGIFICIAVIFDLLDGNIARFLKRESLLGMQLDSLADLVSFSVAITVLLLLKYDFYLPIVFGSFLLVGCGAYRLARYNVIKVQDPDNKTYVGVPITINGVVFPIALIFRPHPLIITLLLVTMSILMISKIRFKKLF